MNEETDGDELRNDFELEVLEKISDDEAQKDRDEMIKESNKKKSQ